MPSPLAISATNGSLEVDATGFDLVTVCAVSVTGGKEPYGDIVVDDTALDVSAAGTYTVGFSVTDANGDSANTTADIEVVAAPAKKKKAKK